MSIDELIKLLTRFKEQHGGGCSVFVEDATTPIESAVYDITEVVEDYDVTDGTPFAIIHF